MTASPRTVAAVDLGSNSFHMVVARHDGERLEILDRLRERVALAAGLRSDHTLDAPTRERALACLRRFGQRLAGLQPDSVRAVGTNTLRKTADPRPFLEAATEALGQRIEVVAGMEEARMVYLGVARSLDAHVGKRLVVDVGGGSTELIIGEGLKPLLRDSLQMGCVSFQRKYFADGAITEQAMHRAIVGARVQMRGMERRFAREGWNEAVGSSGTVKAVDAILRANGWSVGGITAQGLAQLRRSLLAAGHADRLSLPGLESDRVPVIAAGVAVVTAVFEGLQLDRMTASTGALREGLLWDLLGRIRDEDIREKTVEDFEHRYGVDQLHATRVEESAATLFASVKEPWGLDDPDLPRLLGWGARLHEIGLSIGHSGYHRHGAYILANAALTGFSRDDQAMLAALIHGHRRRLTADRLGQWLAPALAHGVGLKLSVILRLACRVHRTRERGLPTPAINVSEDLVRLTFPPGWLDEHPLTRADLLDEREVLRAAGYELAVD